MKEYKNLTNKEKEIFDAVLNAVDAADGVSKEAIAETARVDGVADAVYNVFVIVKKILLED